MTRRQQWTTAVKGPTFPPKMRVLRGTLLCLPVTSAGEVVANDDDIADAVGLPRRTAQWHLRKAVDAGWLIRTSRNGNGRRVRFVVSIPSEQVDLVPSPERQKLRTGDSGSAQWTEHCDEAGVRNLVAHINKRSASRGEHEAVDDPRHGDSARRNACVSSTTTQLQRRSDDRDTTEAASVVGLRRAS